MCVCIYIYIWVYVYVYVIYIYIWDHRMGVGLSGTVGAAGAGIPR